MKYIKGYEKLGEWLEHMETTVVLYFIWCDLLKKPLTNREELDKVERAIAWGVLHLIHPKDK